MGPSNYFLVPTLNTPQTNSGHKLDVTEKVVKKKDVEVSGTWIGLYKIWFSLRSSLWV